MIKYLGNICCDWLPENKFLTISLVRVTKAILILIFLFNTNPLSAGTDMNQRRIKVISWNVFALPWPINWRSNKVARAKLITKHLLANDYDIIAIQEAFKKRVYKHFLKKLGKKYPYSSGKPPKSKTLPVITNSGLMIFSKFPITKQQIEYFETSRGTDRLSSKGALITSIDVDGREFEFVVSHMQAGGEDKAWIRRKQFDRINRVLSERDFKTPIIIVGDLNIDRYKDEFFDMIEYFNAQYYEVDGMKFTIDHCLNTLKKCPTPNVQEHLDHFISYDNDAILDVEDLHIERPLGKYRYKFGKKHDGRDLSDHFPITGTIVID